MNQVDIKQIQANPVTTRHAMKPGGAKVSLLTGLLAGITASACCAGPLILLLLGVSGSWISHLRALEPVRPLLTLLAVIMLVVAYRKIYQPETTCDNAAVCATRQGRQSQKTQFWIITVTVLLSITFPWYGPIIFE